MKRLAYALTVGGLIAAVVLLGRRLRRAGLSGTTRLRMERGKATIQLAVRGGVRYASSAPRLFAAAGEHRQQLRTDLALQTAEDVASTLGAMKDRKSVCRERV